MNRMTAFFAAALMAGLATAQAQTPALRPLQGGAVVSPAASTPSIVTPVTRVAPVAVRNSVRPDALAGVNRFEQELSAANTDALGRLSNLRAQNPSGSPSPIGKVSPIGGQAVVPPGCDRRALQVGLAQGAFRLRPGQHLVIQGCFTGAPAGTVRMNGSFAGGFVELPLTEWGERYVHAVVPDLKGVFDQDVRVQLRFGDGDFSNELTGKFVARRAVYEVEGQQVVSAVSVGGKGPLVCSWSAVCTPNLATYAALYGPAAMVAKSTHSAIGTHVFVARHPQHRLQGYYATLYFGETQFSNWGPNGEIMVDWSSSADPFLSIVRFDKFIVEAPVGTLGNAKLQSAGLAVPLVKIN